MPAPELARFVFLQLHCAFSRSFCLHPCLTLLSPPSWICKISIVAIEVARGAKCLVRMEGNQTILEAPEPGSAGAQAASGRASERKMMNFTFDKSYWSAGPRDEPGYCSQQTLYDDLGKELLDHGFAGFNACILACECLW